MKKLLLISLLGSFVLVGCGDNIPPECDSKEVKSTLKKIAIQSGITNPKITNQKTLTTDKENQQYLCQAIVSANLVVESIKYSVFWQDEKQKMYYVQIVD